MFRTLWRGWDLPGRLVRDKPEVVVIGGCEDTMVYS
jgi:hypothetical protein